MKNMKKAVSILLVLLMALSMSSMVFADETEAETGSITINGVSEGNTYTIYKLLDLESYDTESGAYSYKVNSKWVGFFATAEAKKYFAVDEQGYATWTAAEDDATVAAFAKLALAHAKANKIAPVKSSKNNGEFVITADKITSGKFSGLELGYYLIDSTMGALCGLTTTNPDASINAKNGSPTVDKQVQEDSIKDSWLNSNTAEIGQVVNFKTTITVHAGAENYVLHDKMSKGLEFVEVTEVKHIVPGGDDHIAELGEMYEVVTPVDGCDKGCTFEVRFKDKFYEGLSTNDKIEVYYTAKVTKDAVIAGEGNPNETWLDFGEDHETTHDTTITYTYGFDIIKTDSQNKLIDGAEFRIYDAAEGGNEVKVVLMDDGVSYRRATADEEDEAVSIAVKDGKVRVVGFDNGTYYLEETVTPEGYNQLAARQQFIIDGNLDAIFNGNIYSTGSGVHVVNKSGTMLPETGGTGTVMFITFGMIVVLAAGVLLVTKRRMSMIDD